MDDRRSPDQVTVGLIQSLASLCHALRGRNLTTDAARSALAEIRLDPAFLEVLVNEKKDVKASPPPLPALLPSPLEPPNPHPSIPTTGNNPPTRTRDVGVKQIALFKTSETLEPTVEDIVKTWNQTFSLPRVNSLGKRLALVQKALKDEFWRENWRDGIRRLVRTKFCMGHNSRKWKADIEWFCETANLDKLLSGKYDNLSSTTEPPKPSDYGRTEI